MGTNVSDIKNLFLQGKWKRVCGGGVGGQAAFSGRSRGRWMDLVLLRVLSVTLLHGLPHSPPTQVPGVFGALISWVGWEGCFMGLGGSRPFQWVLGVLEKLQCKHCSPHHPAVPCQRLPPGFTHPNNIFDQKVLAKCKVLLIHTINMTPLLGLVGFSMSAPAGKGCRGCGRCWALLAHQGT